MDAETAVNTFYIRFKPTSIGFRQVNLSCRKFAAIQLRQVIYPPSIVKASFK